MREIGFVVVVLTIVFLAMYGVARNFNTWINCDGATVQGAIFYECIE